MKLDQVLNIDTTEILKIDINSEPVDMTLYQVSRWAALMRGIDFIDEKARQLKISLDDDKSLMKPLALQKYVDEETPAMVTEIKNLLEKGDQE